MYASSTSIFFVTFHLFEQEYFLIWRDLSSHLGFNRKCSIDLDHALRGFNRHEFWREFSGQNAVGKFQPCNMNIQHPTLRYMHRWIAMTLIPRDDARIVRNDELRILYAMVKKIKISPVISMIKQRLEKFKMSRHITFMSLVTRIASKIGALDNQNVVYISTPRVEM